MVRPTHSSHFKFPKRGKQNIQIINFSIYKTTAPYSSTGIRAHITRLRDLLSANSLLPESVLSQLELEAEKEIKPEETKTVFTSFFLFLEI